jgi:hypothetical protein
MMQWKIEHLDDTFMVTTPDESASFVVSRWSLTRLGAGLLRAALGELGGDPGCEGVIDCDEFVYIPYRRPGELVIGGRLLNDD